jgi:hypothetical protein
LIQILQANALAVNKKEQSVLDLCKSDEMREVVEAGIRAMEALKVLRIRKLGLQRIL